MRQPCTISRVSRILSAASESPVRQYDSKLLEVSPAQSRSPPPSNTPGILHDNQLLEARVRLRHIVFGFPCSVPCDLWNRSWKEILLL